MNNKSRFICTILVVLFIFYSTKTYLQEVERQEKEDKTFNVFNNSNLLTATKFEKYELESLAIDFVSVVSSQNVQYYPPGFNVLYKHLVKVPEINQNIAESILKSKANVPELFHFGFRFIGATAGGYGPPLPGTQNKTLTEFSKKNLEEKIQYLKLFSDFDMKEQSIEESYKLPPHIKHSLLELIYFINEINYVIKQFSDPILADLKLMYPDFENHYYEILLSPWTHKQLFDFSVIDVLAKTDFKKLSLASRLMIEQIQKFTEINITTIDSDFKKCLIETPWGKIGIFGTGDDIINDEYALLINFGGNDTYNTTVASSISLNKPIGILIDFKGDDNYLCKEGYLARGVLGMGILFDLQGDDEYYSEGAGLASSLFGSSLLYDCSGNDKYLGHSDFSLGAAHFGVAVLCDQAGIDIYQSKDYSQAYGGTLGAGLLIDFEGNDYYGSIDQSDDLNKCLNSFVQGASSGRWAEATDGQSLGGGVGFLLDFSGDDQYYANRFSQAASYYFSLGLLYDHSGDDQYNAVSHSQGYSAHFAISGFIEKTGNDIYNKNSDKEKISQIIGSGRDFSSGWLIDCEGDDEYHFGNRSAGIGDMNGIGVFWDEIGGDAYFWHHNTINQNAPSLGESIKMSEPIRIDYRFFNPPNPMNLGIYIDNTGQNDINYIEK